MLDVGRPYLKKALQDEAHLFEKNRVIRANLAAYHAQLKQKYSSCGTSLGAHRAGFAPAAVVCDRWTRPCSDRSIIPVNAGYSLDNIK